MLFYILGRKIQKDIFFGIYILLMTFMPGFNAECHTESSCSQRCSFYNYNGFYSSCQRYVDVLEYANTTCHYSMLYKPSNFTVEKIEANCNRNEDSQYVLDVTISDSFLSAFNNFTLHGVDNIVNLVLDFCNVENIAPQSFNNYKKLESLKIRNNNFTHLKEQSIINLPLLVEVDLSNNSISTIEKNAFYNLSSLEKIDLSFNNITILLNGSFSLLDSLQTLLLSNNKIKSTESIVLEWESLSTLDLSSNEILSLAFINSTNLEVLQLNQNKINQINPEIFQQMPLLTFLNLRSNFIEFIPTGTFGQQHSLLNLDLSLNKISDLNIGTLIGLNSLESLNISHNDIEFLSDYVFHNTPNLITLDLSYNKLINLNVWYIHSLEHLNIMGNNWKCSTLSNLLRFGKKIIQSGFTSNKVSLNGIACINDDSSKPDSPNVNISTNKQIPNTNYDNLIKALNNLYKDKSVQNNDTSIVEVLNQFMKQNAIESKNDVSEISEKLNVTNITNILMLILMFIITGIGFFIVYKKMFVNRKNNVKLSKELEPIL